MAQRDKKSEKKKPDVGQKAESARKGAGQDNMKSEHEAKERLGTGLRSLYRNVLEEPLPADMMALLDQLDDNTSGTEGNADKPKRSH